MEKKTRKSLLIGLTMLVLVALLLIGATYAYFRLRVVGNDRNKSVIVTSQELKLVYEDDSDDAIGVTYLEPSDTVYTKTFTVSNESTASVNINYEVYLINVVNQFVRKDDVKFTLSCLSSDGNSCNGVTSETTFPSENTLLARNTIGGGETHTYTYSFTYRDTGTNQSVDMGKELSAKIQIFGENQKGIVIPYESRTLAYNVINNAMNNVNGTTYGDTLTAVATSVSASTFGKTENTVYTKVASATTSNYYTYAKEYTINSSGAFTLVNPKVVQYSTGYEELKGMYIADVNGNASNTAVTTKSQIYKVSPSIVSSTSFNYSTVTKYVSTENILATNEDDNGTTYYYRGGVVDNYVNFADMCWRIVRIEGDDTVKLILEDKDNTCETANGNWDIGLGNYGYSKNVGVTYTKINYLNDNEGEEAYDYTSSMATAFQNFQNTFTEDELSKLKSGNWCYDDTKYLSSTATVAMTDAEIIARYNYGYSMYSYSYVRLQGASTKNPSFKCYGTVMDKFSDKTTDMYVATLTADEVMYAGTKPYGDNTSYYLLNSYQKENLSWFTLTPSHYNGGSDYEYIYSVGNMGAVNAAQNSSDNISLRPAVRLVANIKIKGGNGTKSNPYKV